MSRKSRDPTISVRFPGGGVATVDARAKAVGKTRNAFIVEASLGQPMARARPVPTAERQMFGLILGHAAKARAFADRLPLDLAPAVRAALEDHLRQLEAIRTCAMLGLGKDP